MGSELVLAGIRLVPAIAGIVAFIKSLGVSGKSLTLASFLVGVAAFALYKAAELFPEARPWIEAVWFVLAGPITSGLYDITRDLFRRS